MKAHVSINRSASVAVALLLGAAPLALAQAPAIYRPTPATRVAGMAGTKLFEWSGRVDREVQVAMRDNRVWTNNVGASEHPGAQSSAFSRLPNGNGTVAVQVLEGRGDVDVIQQPSRANDYTAIVRINDSKSGSGSYRIAAYWQGSGGNVYGRDDHRDDRHDDHPGRGDDRNGPPVGRPDNGALVHFSGTVDADVELRIQNGRVDVRRLSGQEPTNVRTNARAMGRHDATLAIDKSQGRGTIMITQQPRAQNGYTTIVRIRDTQGGAGYYDFNIVER